MRIEEAEGYIALGMFQDAWLALDEIPTDRQLSSAVLRCRALCLMGFEAWSRGEAVALILGEGDEDDRRMAAAFFHEGAVWHAEHTGLALARHWASQAIRVRPEQRLAILGDLRFPEGFTLRPELAQLAG